MLGATVLGGTIVTSTAQVAVFFFLTIGVGRSIMKLEPFHNIGFSLPVGAPPLRRIWTNSVLPPAQQELSPTVFPDFLTAVTAETIMLEAQISGASLAAGSFVNIQVDGMFAPSTHLRPEWYEHKFPGGELGGA